LGKSSFYECNSLKSVLFECDSQLEQIEQSAFRGTCLKSIEIPSSVIVLGEISFFSEESWQSLESLSFQNGSRLREIGKAAFPRTRLCSVIVPCSVEILGMKSFEGCKSLKSVTFENGSRYAQIEMNAIEANRASVRATG
jgi:hypothetical protein